MLCERKSLDAQLDSLQKNKNKNKITNEGKDNLPSNKLTTLTPCMRALSV
jgi:hypothetical protein